MVCIHSRIMCRIIQLESSALFLNFVLSSDRVFAFYESSSLEMQGHGRVFNVQF